MATEKTYSRVSEAEDMIVELCEQYPDELWAVTPNIINVLGCDNKERPKACTTLASIKPIRGVEKAVMMLNNVSVRYIIEIFWSDWNKWSQKQKAAIVFHELLHVAAEIGKTVKHDLQDFAMMIDALGVNWVEDPNLPNLLNEKVQFDLALRANVPEDAELKVDTGDEIVKEAEKETEPEEPENWLNTEEENKEEDND